MTKKMTKIREEWMSRLVKDCYGKIDRWQSHSSYGKPWAVFAHACKKCDVRAACKEEALA